jgi:LysR family transcriptional regulator, low CO2-responsive transcriptional regulator
MSFAELKAFDAVARQGSFVKAAKELARTQPTLSVQIASLEKAYCAELIVRSRGKVICLTPLGERLREITRTLFTLEQDAYNLLLDAGNLTVGTVRIMATAPVIAVRLSKALNERFPNVDCRLHFGNSDVVLQSVLKCDADFGILGGDIDHPDCIAVPVAKPEIVLVASKDHPAAATGIITKREFAREILLIREPGSETRDLLLDKMKKYGYRPARLVEIGRRSGAVAAAAAGMGLAAISAHEFEANEALCIIRFESFHVFGTNYAICLRKRSKSALIQALLDSCTNLPETAKA